MTLKCGMLYKLQWVVVMVVQLRTSKTRPSKILMIAHAHLHQKLRPQELVPILTCKMVGKNKNLNAKTKRKY
jgi:hypothetical protein